VTAQQTQTSGDAERAELDRLRAENAKLRAAVSAPGAGPPTEPAKPLRWRRRGRSLAAFTLILLGCLLAPLAVVSVWARSEVTDTDRYVATVAPLASDPAIQQAMATTITNKVFEYIDVEELTTSVFTAIGQSDLLPPQVAAQVPALAPLVANGIRNFTAEQVNRLVESEVFASAWVEANRAAHEQLVAALTGEGDVVAVNDGTVSVNMAAFLTAVKERLISRGFELAERIPAVEAEFVIFQSADLAKVQRGFDLLNTLGLWLPLVCLVLIALGIYLARNHRLAFIGAGFGVALAMLAVAIALIVVRRIYLDSVPPELLPPSAAADMYDTVVRYLREAIRAGAVLGLVVAAGAFLAGPSRTATTVRRWLVAGFAALRGALSRTGVGLESTTARLAPGATVLRVVVVAVALAILLLQRYKTPELVIWLTVAVLLAFAVIQFLVTPPRPAAAEPVIGAAAPAPA